MRVITGALRGKRLVALEGLDVRPTSDKVKEAVFSIIQFDLPAAQVLDLFAGGGQLGIEAISRGAKSCVFVDRSRDAVDIVRKNVDSCRISSQARIVNSDSIDYLRRAAKNKAEFDIVFADPPYERGLLERVLPLISEVIKPLGTVVCEHESELELPETVGRLCLYRKYSYGKKIALTVYKAGSEEDEK